MPSRPTPLCHIAAALRATRGRPLDVLGVGEISHDLVLQLPPQALLREPVADKLSLKALTTLGGGQIATAMVAARRLGLRAGLCGAVGDDAAGQEQRAELQAAGVELSRVAVCAGAQTRLALILVDEHGDRRVLEWRHPELHPRPGEPTQQDVQAARLVHLDGTYPLVSLRTAQLAKAAGTLVSIDLDLVRDCDRAALTELVALADLCVVSARFPTAFTGEPDPSRAAHRLARATAGFVVVTRGELGGVAVVDGDLHRFPALRPPSLVDTTACGDTFHAALLTFLIEHAEHQGEPGAAAPDNAARAVAAAATATNEAARIAATPDDADRAASAGATDEAARVAATPDDADRAASAGATDEAALAAAAVRFASAAAALKCGDLGRRGCPTRAQVTDFLARGAAGSADA